VITYRARDAAEAILAANDGKKVNRIVEVDFGGNLAVSNAVLAPGGVIAAYGSAANMTPLIPFRPMMFNHTTVRMILIYALSTQERARAIDRLTLALESNVLSHAIAAKFDLTDVAEAHLAVESGQLIGNAVIAID
jgi:NADPH:quinone reductase